MSLYLQDNSGRQIRREIKGGPLGEKVGEKLGENVGEKTGEKVGESLGDIHKLNLCQQGNAPQFIHFDDFYFRFLIFKNLYILQTFIPGWCHYTSCTCLFL